MNIKPEHLNPAWLWARRKDPNDVDVPWHGVYYLFAANGTVMYVGQSAWVKGRISSHKCQGKIPFTSYAMVPVRADNDRIRMEKEAIEMLKPPYNRRYNTGPYPSSLLPTAPKFRISINS